MSEVKTAQPERTGFVGNLTPEQETALNQFKGELAAKNITSDDYECLRFLRARKFDVAQALEVILEYKAWYTKNDIATIHQRPPPRSEILSLLVPSAFYGFDKAGHPIYIERTGSVNCELFMNQFTDNEIYMAHVWGQEQQIRRCHESSERLGLPRGSIESFTTILDVGGLSLAHRAMVKFSKLITEADSKYYPERMHRTVIVNPSGLFTFFWKLVRGWLDPVTSAKIIVCTEGNPELFEIADRDQVPKRYGGTADVPGLEDPNLEELYKLLCTDKHRPEEWTNHKIPTGPAYIRTIPMNAHETYSWVFRSNDPVGFEAYFRPSPVEGKQGPDRVVTAYSTAPANKIPNQGIFITDEPGELFLVWKNENWFASVDLSYIVENISGAATEEPESKSAEPAVEGAASATDAAEPTTAGDVATDKPSDSAAPESSPEPEGEPAAPPSAE